MAGGDGQAAYATACLNEGLVVTHALARAVRTLAVRPFVSEARAQFDARFMADSSEHNAGLSSIEAFFRPIPIRYGGNRHTRGKEVLSVFAPLNTVAGLDHASLGEGMSVLEIGLGWAIRRD